MAQKSFQNPEKCVHTLFKRFSTKKKTPLFLHYCFPVIIFSCSPCSNLLPPVWRSNHRWVVIDFTVRRVKNPHSSLMMVLKFGWNSPLHASFVDNVHENKSIEPQNLGSERQQHIPYANCTLWEDLHVGSQSIWQDTGCIKRAFKSPTA